MKEFEIIWSNQAKNSVKEIYEFFKEKPLAVAKKAIYFSKQYQPDDINPEYRRIIVRDYKLLYKENNNKIVTIDIISSRQSPEIFKNI
ncbi:hypothetical protein MATR_15320 [Marivirga tractuosa]|uniref:Plasmid stabilization system n=1 Tax=Marivirga tractuosa (strain ATCC 23168 / DSM 4126 / NBRC 15989 / NCIMB 1408 / VKM B-1430 / H-43) TaxID=643867 RepID=E4TSM2_MARTH|nr:type II toxin-antitoxin system RelE/ParE family toxin [Marivirga tractuosa]ADR20842.1 hypothetical protein Ftrac_0840 [Marivirga tractuosa DSM 4126]BDD14707.1 hypothetical protein MATR_15320 [Marivirga tractuosa]